VLILVTVLPAAFLAQTKRNTKPKTATPAVTPQPTPDPTPKIATPPKRNERPNDGNSTTDTKTNAPQPPNYFYEFVRPGFTYSPIRIEHDEAGRGTITFQKEGLGYTEVTDPIELSPVTLGKLKDAFTALNFLDSTETYQTPRDYSTMGNASITLKREGRSRSVKYNWTENKNAKVLSDEYRRISNEYIWRFEMTLARENQPLSAPQLMDQMADYLRRSEISDPPQLVPLLTALSNDERIPLIARDKAGRLADQIQKAKR
jgi:hypothetical protein